MLVSLPEQRSPGLTLFYSVKHPWGAGALALTLKNSINGGSCLRRQRFP